MKDLSKLSAAFCSFCVLLAIALILFGCSGPAPSSEPERATGACEPRATCDAPGFSWVVVQSGKVGACSVYQYACAREGADPAKLCPERWETDCPALDYDPQAGERGE